MQFEMPEAKIVLFENEDVITTSGTGCETANQIMWPDGCDNSAGQWIDKNY